MLSEEEIENMKNYFSECILKDTVYEEELTISFIKIAKEYIKQLESNKQKLIEKLEEDHKQHIDLIQEQYNQYSGYYARTGGYPNQMKQDVAKLSGEKNKIAEYLFFVKGEKE